MAAAPQRPICSDLHGETQLKSASENSGLVRWGLWAAALLLGIYLLAIIFGDHGLTGMKAMREELKQIRQENARLEKENIDLYRSINRLKNDPAYIEQVAREELNMVRPDEIVFRFDDAADKNQQKQNQ
ncbi:MAG: septum formation initiator family protein [Desulfosalsimonas sp.]